MSFIEHTEIDSKNKPVQQDNYDGVDNHNQIISHKILNRESDVIDVISLLNFAINQRKYKINC